MNIKQAFTAIDYCRLAGLTLHLIGKHGVGKSSIIYQYAEKYGYEVMEIRVGQMADAGDLIGLQQFIKLIKAGGVSLEEAIEATKHILPEWFLKATVPGAKIIIFIDELNRGHKDLLQAIFELVYDRSLKGVKISDSSFIVAASNPPTGDYAVLDFSDSAFQDRFVHVKFEPTAEEFLEFIKTTAPTSSVGEFIQEYRQMLENKQLEDFQLDFVKPSRRSWHRITMLEAVKAPAEIELELFMGIVGYEAANAYLKFRETHFKSIKAEEVLNNYKSAKKDVAGATKKNRVDLLGTLVQELGELFKGMESLTPDQADNIANLIHDLPIEVAYSLAIVVKENSQCTKNVPGYDPKKYDRDYAHLGLFSHKKFVERVVAIKSKRDQMKTPEETANA